MQLTKRNRPQVRQAQGRKIVHKLHNPDRDTAKNGDGTGNQKLGLACATTQSDNKDSSQSQKQQTKNLRPQNRANQKGQTKGKVRV